MIQWFLIIRRSAGHKSSFQSMGVRPSFLQASSIWRNACASRNGRPPWQMGDGCGICSTTCDKFPRAWPFAMIDAFFWAKPPARSNRMQFESNEYSRTFVLYNMNSWIVTPNHKIPLVGTVTCEHSKYRAARKPMGRRFSQRSIRSRGPWSAASRVSRANWPRSLWWTKRIEEHWYLIDKPSAISLDQCTVLVRVHNVMSISKYDHIYRWGHKKEPAHCTVRVALRSRTPRRAHASRQPCVGALKPGTSCSSALYIMRREPGSGPPNARGTENESPCACISIWLQYIYVLEVLDWINKNKSK